MAKPWEKYQAAEAAPGGAKPWEKYDVAQAGRISGSVTDAASDPGLMDKALEYGGKALDVTGRVLDYPGGLLRTGLANSVGLLSGRGNVVSEEDAYNALKGKAPSSAQLLEKLGVDDGGSVEVPFLGNTSLRDVEGLALDIGTSPSGVFKKGAQALGLVGKAGKAATALDVASKPASTALQAGGKKMYKSAFKKIDERLIEQGKKPLADVMLENGAKAGSTKTIQSEAAKIGKKALDERSALYTRANDLGVSVDLGYPLKNAEATIGKIAKNPGQKELADKFTEFMNKYKAEGKVPLDALSEWKSALYDSLPESAFAGGKLKGAAKEFEQALARDFKEAIEMAGNKAEKGLGDKIAKANETLGTTLSARKPLKMQVRRGVTPNAVTPVDAIVGSMSLPALALKKGADISKTATFRTAAGKGLMSIGNSGAADGLLRQGLIKLSRGKKLTPEEQQEIELRYGSDE